MADLAILILAAGASRRMRGADKLLEDVHGAPCVQVMAKRALQVTPNVMVTVPDLNHPRADALAELDVTLVPVPDAAVGMSESLKTGAAAIPNKMDVMVLPADMPDITGHDMAQLWAVFQVSGVKILQAGSNTGVGGHPVVFSHGITKEFQSLAGDTGAKPLVQKYAKTHAIFPLSDARALTDLDTPEDWANWRSKLQ